MLFKSLAHHVNGVLGCALCTGMRRNNHSVSGFEDIKTVADRSCGGVGYGADAGKNADGFCVLPKLLFFVMLYKTDGFSAFKVHISAGNGSAKLCHFEVIGAFACILVCDFGKILSVVPNLVGDCFNHVVNLFLSVICSDCLCGSCFCHKSVNFFISHCYTSIK